MTGDDNAVQNLLAALLAGVPSKYAGADVKARGLFANLLSSSPVSIKRGYIDPYTTGLTDPVRREITIADDGPYTLLHEMLHHVTENDLVNDPQVKRLAELPSGPLQTKNPANRLHDLIYRLSQPSFLGELRDLLSDEHKAGLPPKRDATDIQADELRSLILNQMVKRRHDIGVEALK